MMRLYRCLFIFTLTLAWPPTLARAAQVDSWRLAILDAAHGDREAGAEPPVSHRDYSTYGASRTVRAPDIAKPKRSQSLMKAYKDAFNILKGNNSCSRFFGGPVATIALDKLTAQLRQEPLPGTHIGVQMYGTITNVTDDPTGFSYRLFENATVNSNGPFFKRKRDPSEDFVPNVGSFAPNTREARVSILLHELAHLVRAHDRNWLIPDDGGSPEQSARNTETIEAICGNQIRTLNKSEASPESPEK